MIKQTKEDRVVKVEVRRRVCDLCEKTMIEGAGFFRVAPAINENDGKSYSVTKQSGMFDVCSAECLSKRAKAIGLVADTKLFPKLRAEMSSSVKKAVFKSASAYDESSLGLEDFA